ncbi:Ribosomal L32p protein family [Perilla frutescens var. frutescens]|nr:Ribosomal L32p protein family [Perilla frutescens var. frutescens]
MLRYAAGKNADFAAGGFRLLLHSLAQPAPLATAFNNQINITLPPFVLPENNDESNRGSHFLDSPFFGGAMELMAVPKRKVSPHRRGIRNGPKALKPVPVIIKCKVCGRVKLPHFFCCSGIKPNPEENNS